ncbi:MAG: FecR family protein [Pedobacter sp.]|nr:MAG: FecR family protein [Pedobacter sp.]
MEDSKKRAELLIDRYLSGAITAAEAEELNAAYLNAAMKKQYPSISENDLTDLNQRGRESLVQLIAAIRATRSKRVRLWPRIAVAAAAVAAITLGVWFYNSERGVLKQIQDDVVYNNDIAPGKNTATLTLATGKVIDLDTSRTSVVVADSVKTMTMLTATTPRGGTYQVVLPDGTIVWLNADSKISFPSQFNGKERKILLEGEAYFEVAKDKARPFIVSTENQDVRVLGTRFNINSYENEGSVKTTLLEGSVRVLLSRQDAALRKDVVLTPGQQSILAADKIAVENVDTEEAIAWKNNEFSFNGDDLQSVMRQIARWYDVEVVYEGNVESSGFVSTISRNKKLSEILRALEMNQGVHFKIEGRRIRVTQ